MHAGRLNGALRSSYGLPAVSLRRLDEDVMHEPKFRRRVKLMEAEIGDEIVALDRQAGHCFGFNPVASDVWKMLAEPLTQAEICGRLIEAYDVARPECESEVAGLIERMAALGLVEQAGAGA